MAPLYQVFALSEPNAHPPLGLAAVLSYVRTALESDAAKQVQLPDKLSHSVFSVSRNLSPHCTPVFLFSHYIWNDRYNRRLCQKLKSRFPNAISIHGGPSIPKRENAIKQFFQELPEADLLVHGEGENSLLQILRALVAQPRTMPKQMPMDALMAIGNVSTADLHADCAARAADLNLDNLPAPNLDPILQGAFWLASIIETNRGCPYSCSFCDWGSLTKQKIRQFSLARIQTDIDWAAQQKIEVMYVADANFGILPRDIDIAHYIAAKKRETGFPRKLCVNYAKNATERVVQIEKIFQDIGVSAGIVAIQTTDPATLAAVQRANIRTDKLAELVSEFHRLRIPVTTDLLLGLPGGNYDSFVRDLQWCFDHAIHTNVYCLQVLPNSELGDPETMHNLGIVVNSNNVVVATHSWSPQDLTKARQTFALYHAIVERSLLKYILLFLQHECGVSMNKVLKLLHEKLESTPKSVQRTLKLFEDHTDIQRNIITYSPAMLAIDWPQFCREFLHWIASEVALTLSPSVFETLVLTQSSVLPSRWGKPREVRLPHDFPSYLSALRATNKTSSPKLDQFGPGNLSVGSSDRVIERLPLRLLLPYGTHLIAFESPSSLQETVIFDRILFARDGWLESITSIIRNFAKLAQTKLALELHNKRLGV